VSDLPGVQDWLPDVGAQALHSVRRHIAAETSTDTDLICSTVSRNVFFAVPVRTREGNEIPPGTVLTSYDEVHDYYAKRADSYVVVNSCQLRSIAGDWYVFNESAATLHPSAGPEFVVNSAILFPTASDGIRGEICITRHPFEDVAAGRVPEAPVDGSFPAAEMSNAALLDAWLVALRAGRGTEIEALLSPRHSLAIRLDDRDGVAAIHTGTEREAATRILGEIFAGGRDIALVNRLVSAWYVFAEYAIPLERGGLHRIALLQSVEQGRLGSSFGYGWEDA
jgi:hypothetical protein